MKKENFSFAACAFYVYLPTARLDEILKTLSVKNFSNQITANLPWNAAEIVLFF